MAVVFRLDSGRRVTVIPKGGNVTEYKFKATIEPADHGHGYVFFPFDTKEAFGTRAQIRVKATFDGVAYTGSLVKYGHPQHMMPIVKSILETIGKRPGDTVDVIIERDESERQVEVPDDFAESMKKAGVASVFEKLSYTHRKEYCCWISDAKREETRRRRITNGIEMLKKGIKTPG